MAEVRISANQLKLTLADTDGNSTPVLLDLDGGRYAGEVVRVEFTGVERMCQVSFCMTDNKLIMVTRNYKTDDNKAQVVTLHDFNQQPPPDEPQVATPPY